MNITSRQDDLRSPSWANLQLALVMVTLVAANISIAVSQLFLGLAMFVQLFRRFVRKEPAATTGLGRWVLALAGWALLMIPFSADPGQSLLFYKRFFLFAALWVVGSVALDGRRQWMLLGAVLAGALVISLYGQIHVWRATGSLFKVRLGEMSNPMTSGCLLMMSLLLAWGFLLAYGRKFRSLIWVAAASLPVALGLVQTMTRSAWLGLAAGLAAMLLMVRPRLLVIFVLVGLVFLLAVPRLPDDVLTPRLKQRLDANYFIKGSNTKDRVLMWQEGLAIVKRHPLTGVGDCDLTSIGPKYYEHPDMYYYGHLHSNPVMLAAIWGIPGFLLGMGFLAAQLWLLVGRWRRRADGIIGPARGWVLGAIGVWTGFFVAGFTEWYFGDAESMLLYLAITGVALGLPLSPSLSGERNV